MFVQSVVSFVLQNEFAKWRKSRANKGNYQKWQDEVQDLIEVLDEKPCLWDIFSNDYTKREVKERAYAELAEHFDSSSAIVKVNYNAITSSKCWSNMLDTLTQTSPTYRK